MIYLLLLMTLVTGCQYIPEVAKGIENIETDTAISIQISKETIQKDTDLEVNVKVQNKDEKEK